MSHYYIVRDIKTRRLIAAYEGEGAIDNARHVADVHNWLYGREEYEVLRIDEE